ALVAAAAAAAPAEEWGLPSRSSPRTTHRKRHRGHLRRGGCPADRGRLTRPRHDGPGEIDEFAKRLSIARGA
ncbi:unnamed protein product, partial [Ectocarpus sp. 4 AP-2014]